MIHLFKSTYINQFRKKKLTRWSSAGGEWISNVTLVADTDRYVVGHLAVGIAATKARTRVHTLEVPTLLGGRAVSVDDTFRSTGHIGVSKVVGNALAGGSPLPVIADSIGSTW